jgi:ubiquinone/menaquinone biosynthesis C-methylase UbiE
MRQVASGGIMKKAVFDPVAHFYDQEQKHFRHDIPFYVDYAKKCRGEVLELACGTGRVLIPIARSGARITGLDISSGMLGIAGGKVKQLEKKIQKRITLVQGDMTNFRLRQKFASIIIAFRSFQSLVDKKAQAACLACVHRHLAKDGLLILDLFVPWHNLLAQVRRKVNLGKFYDSEKKVYVSRCAEDEYDLAAQTLKEDRFYEWTDKQGRSRRQIWSFELSYLFRYEMELLLEKYGFKVENIFGDFKGSPYDYYSGEQIFAAKKA